MSGAPGGPRRVVILGSTGSIGRQALDVVRANPGAFRVTGLVAGWRCDELVTQAAEFRPAHCGLVGVAPAEGAAPAAPRDALPAGVTAHHGPQAAVEVIEAAAPDIVVNAISGLAGLPPALAALARPGVVLAMASKEPVVAAAHLLRAAASERGSQLIPVDSETTAVAQCLAAVPLDDVAHVYITASGGPFWGRDPRELEDVQPSEAVRHPRWAMGPKISVDSATLFNKGLEVLEVSRLFAIPQRRVKILVHRESVTHALLELSDGSMIAQLGPTDMRVPIAQAMFWPGRAPRPPARLALAGLAMAFAVPDLAAWPCLRAALCAGADGGTAPAAVSAADEELVASYLGGHITFGAIGRGLWAALREHRARYPAAGAEPALAEVLEVDGWARVFAQDWAANKAARERGCPPDQVGEDYCR